MQVLIAFLIDTQFLYDVFTWWYIHFSILAEVYFWIINDLQIWHIRKLIEL